MTRVVLDASVALAWCFPDETSEEADRVLVGLAGHEIVVPAIWGLEVANVILVGERSNRLRDPEVRTFMTLLDSLGVIQDTQAVEDCVSGTLPVARQYGLSAYNAAYLELALRKQADLATLDRKLRRAARKAGIALF